MIPVVGLNEQYTVIDMKITKASQGYVLICTFVDACNRLPILDSCSVSPIQW